MCQFLLPNFCLREILVKRNFGRSGLALGTFADVCSKIDTYANACSKIGRSSSSSRVVRYRIRYVESTQPESRKCVYPTVLMWRMTRTFALFQKCVKIIMMVCGCSTTLDTPNQHWMKGRRINLAVRRGCQSCSLVLLRLLVGSYGSKCCIRLARRSPMIRTVLRGIIEL
jgi:hypothetical protein